MANWLTTHYPHPVPDTTPWHVYVQREHRRAIEGIGIGDRVFFYEYAAQKSLKNRQQFPGGAQGVVRVAKVSGPVYPREARIEYADGTIKDWSWGVPTDDADIDGFVSREDLLRILGYKPGSYLRGFNAGTGVKRLDDDQADAVLRLFKADRRTRD